MRALDTCILARVLLRDDPAQTVAAEKLISEPFYLPLTVLLELGWVLTSRAGIPRAAAAAAMRQIVELPTCTVDSRAHIDWALAAVSAGADIGDALHCVASAHAVGTIATFDQSFARHLAGGPVDVALIETGQPR